MDEERIADGAYGYDGWNHPPCEGDSDVHGLLLNRSPISNRYFQPTIPLPAHKEHAALSMRRGHGAVTGRAGDGLLWLFLVHFHSLIVINWLLLIFHSGKSLM